MGISPLHNAAMILISILIFGFINSNCTVQRTSVLSATTQASQAAFIAPKSAGLARKIVASRIRFFFERIHANNMLIMVSVLAVCIVAFSFIFSSPLEKVAGCHCVLWLRIGDDWDQFFDVHWVISTPFSANSVRASGGNR